MALATWARLRLNWGGFDFQAGTDHPYSPAQSFVGGPTANGAAGEIGVRRASLIFDRSTYTPSDDDMTMHFDFLNITGGAPDDTWITADYTALETALETFWGSTKTYSDPKTGLREIRWHRVGYGVLKPNPVERTYTLAAPVYGTGTAGLHPPQVACSITFRTAVRRSWGRTYLPFNGGSLSAQGRLTSTATSTIATATSTLVAAAATADFYLVVTSIAKQAALTVEKVEVDDVTDIVRRRRFKHTLVRTIQP